MTYDAKLGQDNSLLLQPFDRFLALHDQSQMEEWAVATWEREGKEGVDADLQEAQETRRPRKPKLSQCPCKSRRRQQLHLLPLRRHTFNGRPDVSHHWQRHVNSAYLLRKERKPTRY